MTQINKLVSVKVVIPTKDRPDSLRKAIISARNQSDVETGIIVIENNSVNADAVKRVCEEEKVTFISIGRSGNANKARNIGMMTEECDYIAFLDSDDEWLPDHLSSSIEILKEKEAEFLYSSAYVFDGCNTKIRNAREVKSSEHPIDYLLGWSRGYAQTSSFVIKGNCVNRVKWDEGMKRNQDLQFFLNAAKELKMVCKKKPTYTINWLRGEKRSYDLGAHVKFMERHFYFAKKLTLLRSFLVNSNLFFKDRRFRDLIHLTFFYSKLFAKRVVK